jgi:hypothetical protein
MKTQFTLKAGSIFILFFLINFITVKAQMGINTSTPSNGALLDITSSDKGFLMPRIALTGTDDVTTITPSATTGLMLYNTVTAGVLPVQVTPGFYHWDGAQWRRLYNQGYTLRYQQTSELRADNDPTIYLDIPGLDTGDFNIPFSGDYQLVIRGYLSAGDLDDTSSDGACTGSISLWMDTNNSTVFTKLEESFVTATSKSIDGGSDFYNMANSTTIVYNITLDVMNSYSFKIRGREWQRENVVAGVSGRGVFGRDTDSFLGSSGEIDAQRGTMTFTLLRQQ